MRIRLRAQGWAVRIRGVAAGHKALLVGSSLAIAAGVGLVGVVARPGPLFSSRAPQAAAGTGVNAAIASKGGPGGARPANPRLSAVQRAEKRRQPGLRGAGYPSESVRAGE